MFTHQTLIGELSSEIYKPWVKEASNMKDQVGILRVLPFALGASPSITGEINPSEHLALFYSHVANTHYSVLERQSVKRSHVIQSVRIK